MKVNILTIAASAAAAVLAASCTSSEITRFATTDMTWAEFYAAEVGASSSELEQNGYDAVTSATMNRTKRFTNHNVSEDGQFIYGPKNVAVGMTESVYKTLSEEQKARFTFYEDSTFTACKVMDKNGNFGKYTSTAVTASDVTPSISSGSSSNWGNYTVSLRGLKIEGAYHGVVVTDNEGNKYGLKTLDNIWLNATELALNVAEFSLRGNKPSYKNTASLEGKTITNITYIMSGKDAISVDTDLFVKTLCGATVSAAEAKAGKDVKVAIEGLPEGYTVVSVRSGAGRQAVALTDEQYSFENGTLTLLGDITPSAYRVNFQSEQYTDLAVSFEVK